jgi:DNA-binding FrmR family transcriptional regulator
MLDDMEPVADANTTPVSTPGYHDDKAKVMARLRRIEGQVRGLQRLVDEDAYCVDVLTQLAAVTKALQGVGVALINDHLRHCVADAASGEGERTIDDVVDDATHAIQRLLRT